MEQLGLHLTAPRARKGDPETSHAAARKVTKGIAANHRNHIAAALDRGPANIYEIGKRAGLSHVQVARRMIELQAMGIAEPTEQKIEGCRVWRKTSKGAA